MSQDRSFYLITWGWSEVQNQVSRRHLLLSYLFEWGWSEIQHPDSIGLIYLLPSCLEVIWGPPFYLGVDWSQPFGLKTAHFTFLPGGFLRSRIKHNAAHFTFLPRWGGLDQEWWLLHSPYSSFWIYLWSNHKWQINGKLSSNNSNDSLILVSWPQLIF